MTASTTDRPWLAHYPPGVPADIDPTTHDSVPELFARFTAPYAESIALTAACESLTFAELRLRARAWAAWLATAAGVQPGDRVAVMLPNITAFPVALLGTLTAGAVQVSINPLYTARELHHQLRDSGAKVLLATTALLPTIAKALEGTELERLVFADEPANEMQAPLPVTTFSGALAQGREAAWTPPAIARNDLALLQYTGGTTGVSKGAELSHGNLVANILQVRAMLGGMIEPGRETILTALPLYHIFALMVNFVTFATFGARNVLVANPRDPAELVNALQRESVTLMTGVNTLFGSLLAMPQLADALPRIKIALGGGAAVQRATSERWHERTGRHILEGYGLTETAPVLTVNSYLEPEFTGSTGLPVPSTQIQILDEAGRPVPVGTAGEICAKGPQVMRGYWRRPEATADAFTIDGWFRTGDVGMLDATGHLRICDRKKDMVLVSGFNVYPNEVEGVIAELRGVAECAVTGVPDDKTGEAVRAYIVRNDTALAEADVLSHCRDQLAAYKVPRQVAFVEALPKSTVGKILRRELRELAATQA
jgi:long-chain acyl-CoA synthetase